MKKEEIIVRIFVALCEYNKTRELPDRSKQLWEKAKKMADEIYLEV